MGISRDTAGILLTMGSRNLNFLVNTHYGVLFVVERMMELRPTGTDVS